MIKHVLNFNKFSLNMLYLFFLNNYINKSLNQINLREVYSTHTKLCFHNKKNYTIYFL